ncbi:KR-domain-containing protein [Aspergillus novofumigatus IBT 16806]|uniref:KR-domain-containing protein n=1 Tax=Aspergillus novofumigatus (strain IBT 16806) TaxID=1392255 RepID=A0A2I1BSN4_ASPN1|nr:KR-domain-containing protein [Aspergillus novofumigatus IBT 16806]PKX88366.1 KR-domain-containing protein [Aspergillus novofumigatus IBT 16806]
MDMHQAEKRASQRLLGSRAPQSSDNELSWTSFLDSKEDPWLYDQLLFGSRTFPVAGYVAIAGECVRQLSESKSECFSMKDLSISSSLVFDSDDKLELHAKLRPQGLDEENRQWYEIEIASRNGGQSIGLCTGLVARDAVLDTKMLQDLTQNGDSHWPVSSDYWYDMVADRGIEYGASQRGLSDISVDFTENKASATIMPMLDTTDSAAHPVFIDHCLQLSMIAACKGQGRLLADLSAITSIQHLVVSNNAWSKLRVNSMVNPGRLQNSTCNFSAVNENGLLILSGQCNLTPIPDLERQTDRKLFSFINWDTDSTYHNLNQFLAPFQSDLDSSVVLERLALLYALRSEDIGAQSQTYSKRILKMIGTRRKGRFGLVPDVSPFVECGPSSRTKLIKLFKTQISETELSSLSLALERCLTDNTPFSGSDSERQLLLDQLHPLVRNSGTLCESLRLLAYKNPKLKVLELGSGAKDSTNLLLKALRTQFDEPLYSSYLSASTSLDSTTNLKESLRENGNVQPLIFNAEKRIEEQGLKPGTHDLIIITDFAALGSNATIGAKNLKQLISPQGHVVLLEGVPEPEWLLVLKDYITKESPNASTGSKTKSSFEDVYAALTENGFVFGNQDNDSTPAPKVFARVKQPVPETSSEITVVGPAYHLPLIREIEKTFGDHNIKCVKSTIDGDIPPSRDIMVFVDFDEPYLYNITEAELSRFVKLVSGMKGKMIWVTPSAQIYCKNPNSSMILGLMRTIRSEFKKDITTVELDPKRTMNVSLSKSLLKIYEGLSRRSKSKDLDPDYEYAIVDGEIKIPRLQWTTAEAEYANLAARPAENDSGSQNFSPMTAMDPESVRWRTGGLGRMISTWMVENGARNIIFFSRSAKEGSETTPFFDRLRAQGCTVTPFVGSVTNQPDVEEAIKQATAPIAGVIQMSAVMRDNLMSQMTFDEWQTCVQPKVQGTWNLHHATLSADLDFFLLFSSICGITGQWGQGNYNAANSFLDAFVNYRHGQNLPASVIDIGFMGSIGMAVKSGALMKNLKRSGYYFLNERHLIDALTISFAHSRPGGDQLMHRSQLGLGIRSRKPMAAPTCRVAWKKDSRMAISHHFEPIGGSEH